MPPARSKVARPAAAHCLPAFERWLQSYPLASAWISKKLGGQDNLYSAVAGAGGFLAIDDFLPVNIAAGIECLLRRCVSIVTISRPPDLSTNNSSPSPCAPACPPTRGIPRRRKRTSAATTSSTSSKGDSHLVVADYQFCPTRRRSSKGTVSPKAAAAATLKLPGATSESATAAAASVKLLPLVFRLFSILNPEDFHTFSAAK
jgi:hypothetical protein